MQSAIEREQFSSTYIGNGISIPHGNPKEVMKSHVLIFKNPQGFIWKQHKVTLVFFLVITENDAPVMKKLIHLIAKLSEDDVDQITTIETQSLKQHIIKLIKA